MIITKKTVHILGCGPAGLAAAHAATLAGYDVRIFSRARKSHMFGAQYLHKAIPGIDCGRPVEVKYTLRGTVEKYRRKVYGIDYDGDVSPGTLPENHMAWDIRRAYDSLWDAYGHDIEFDGNITPAWMWANRFMRPMISSIPKRSLCLGHPTCGFQSVGIWAAGEAPERGVRFGRFIDGVEVPDGTVLCNADGEPSWYRASRIFGHATIEWSWNDGPTAAVPAAVEKPISNTCDCWPDVLRVGRYGKWTKGILVHHAFEETQKWIQSL